MLLSISRHISHGGCTGAFRDGRFGIAASLRGLEWKNSTLYKIIAHLPGLVYKR